MSASLGYWDEISNDQQLHSLLAIADDMEPAPPPVPAKPGKTAQLRARLLDSDGLDNLPDPVPLIEGTLWRDTLVLLWGLWGTGKSFLALDWALCVATGKPWQGRPVVQGVVLYVAAEGAEGMAKRRRAWSTAWHQPDLTGIYWLPMAVDLLAADWVEALVEVCRELRPVLVVIDTLSRSIPGGDENRPADMTRAVNSLDRVRMASRATVLVVHHPDKRGNAARGHGSLTGAVATSYEVAGDGRTLRVINDKSKDEAKSDVITLRLSVVGESCVLESHVQDHLDELAASESHLLAVMRDSFGTTGAAGSVLRETSELAKSTHYRALNSLVRRGALINTGTDKRPFYVLPEGAL
ncbi:MAG: hypothetical protein NVSMB13_21010 [Mycobacteriales bacterium]